MAVRGPDNASMTSALSHGLRGLPALRDFVTRFAALLDTAPSEARVLDEGAALLRTLVAHDDWLPDAFAQPHPDHYQQYLLHADSSERFSVVSFVWGQRSL